MKILLFSQGPTRIQAMFFRNARLPYAIGLALSVLAFAAMVWGYTHDKLSFIILLFAVLPAFLIWLLSYTLYKACLPTNWILAIGTDMLWIKYRSYLNSHLASEDPQLVTVCFSEIESAADVIRTEHTRKSGNNRRTTSYRFLDLTLHQPISGELKEALKAERQKQRWQACPLSVTGPAVLRINIRGMHPGCKHLLQQLAQNGITITPQKREFEDFTKPVSDKKQLEEQILGLAERGHKIEAVELARQRYGMNLTEAKQFVDELSVR